MSKEPGNNPSVLKKFFLNSNSIATVFGDDGILKRALLAAIAFTIAMSSTIGPQGINLNEAMAKGGGHAAAAHASHSVAHTSSGHLSYITGTNFSGHAVQHNFFGFMLPFPPNEKEIKNQLKEIEGVVSELTVPYIKDVSDNIFMGGKIHPHIKSDVSTQPMIVDLDNGNYQLNTYSNGIFKPLLMNITGENGNPVACSGYFYHHLDNLKKSNTI